MPAKLNVVTGATGLVGSHVAERLRERGESVRALVRPTSDLGFLQRLGVELVFGDLHDPASLRHAVDGADVVYHCAAKVGDWGAKALFQSEVVDATRNLLGACRTSSVARVLHVSSIAVYGHLQGRTSPITEDEPLGQQLWRWDHYCRAKIRAEEIARQYSPDVTIVRPSWIYGPRDRTTLPRIIKALDAGRVRLIGRGDNLLNIIHAGDVAEGAILAANHPAARGQAYNLSSEGELTQRQFLDLLTVNLGRERVTRHIPFRMAYMAGLLAEVIGRVIRLNRPPHITRYAVALVGRPTAFSTEKARTQLAWRPQVPAQEGVKRSVEWLRDREQLSITV